MAQAFNLTAQLQLQAPGNTNQVMNQIRRQLKPLGVNLKIQNTKNLAQANKNLQSFSRAAQTSQKNVSSLNRTLQESARRFSVITIATGSFLALANSFKKSVKEAIAFERELVRISQVTGKSVKELKSLSDEVTRLSTSFGASSSSLLSVARTLSQAGFAADETRKALDILAKTSLGATFDNIQDTTEGAIAVLRQFSNEARASGGDIAFLEKSLDAINSVSKRFAVESGDLISAIRRTGGVFAAAGGSVNELIALFTSVRATTRESAETIATGLRTIFTRIQRAETVSQLKELNIQLQDSQGRFVGAFEAVRRLSQGLSALDPKDFRFSQIVEQLGGFRQIGKVIPLINQFATAQEALNVAQGASGSVSKDAETAQLSLGVQIQKVREQFDALLRKFQDSSSFRSIAGFAIKLAESFIKVADSLEPLLPLLTSLIGLKLGQGLAPLVGSLAGIGKRTGGSGPVSKFARGGMVPGTGNRDTVPAMLTPGEFVIKKSSVKSLGAGTLAAMNNNRYAAGGIARQQTVGMAIPDIIDTSLKPKTGSVSVNIDEVLRKKVGFGELASKSILDIYGIPANIKGQPRKTLQAKGKKSIPDLKSLAQKELGFVSRSFSTVAEGVGSDEKRSFNEILLQEAKQMLANSVQRFGAVAGVNLDKQEIKFSPKYDLDSSAKGQMFEEIIGAFNGRPIAAEAAERNRPFDFTDGIKAGKLFNALANIKYIDAKISGGANIAPGEFKKKTTSQLAFDLSKSRSLTEGRKFASGGGVSGSDTVPALLTPGEFVMNKSASQSIGYSALNRMNKQGVQGFAKGGAVGVQTFRVGGGVEAQKQNLINFYAGQPETRQAGSVTSGLSANAIADAEKRIQELGISSQDASRVLVKYKQGISKGLTEDQALQAAEKDYLNRRKEQISLIQKSNQQIQKNNTLRKKLGGALVKAGSGLKNRLTSQPTVLGSLKSSEGRQSAAQGLNQAASAAQNFVFLGASVAAVTGQMSNLNDSTKQAINETAGFTTGIVGIGGTLAQILTSQAAAGTASATADLQEASASQAAAASGAKIAAGFTGVAIGITAAIAGLKFFSARNKAVADELSKGIKESLDNIKEGTSANINDIKTSARQEVDARKKSAAQFSGGALATAGSFAVAGAAIGSIVPVVGTAVGAIGGGLLGAAVGVGAALGLVEVGLFGEINARNDEINAINSTIDNLVNLNTGIANVNRASQDIASAEAAGVDSGTLVQRGLEASAGFGGGVGGFQQATNTLALLAEQAGKTAGELKESDFEGDPAALTKFNNATRAAASAQELAAAEAKFAGENLQRAFQETDPSKTFEELVAAGGPFAQSLRANLNAIKAESSIKKIGIEQALAENKRRQGLQNSVEDQAKLIQEENTLRQSLNAENARSEQALRDVTDGMRASQNARNAEIVAIERAAAAQAEFAARIEKTRAFTNQLEEQAKLLSRQGQAIDDFVSNLEGRSTAFQAQTITEIDDISDVSNLQRFFAEVDNVAAQAGPQARASADRLKETTQLLDNARSLQGLDGRNLGESLEQNIRDRLSRIGVSAQTVGGPDTFNAILDSLKESAQKAGGLTQEDISKAFGNVVSEAETLAGQFKAINTNQNAQLANYSKFLDAQDALFNKELEGRSRVAESIAKGAELRAQARGQELSPQAEEAIRRRQAQVQLSGTGLQAGNLRQVAAAKEQAKQTLRNIQAQKRQADVVGLSVKQRAALAKQERQQLKILAAANGELERLADQSERASSILSQIDDERAKRQAQFEIIQDFVVGGEDERKALNNAAIGIQNAVATGSLQGQSAEERSATVGLLDRLANIVIPGTGGLTGEQVKQEVVFRDAVRLGLDPQIAKSIATATSKEQQLINALDRLTEATTTAARAANFATGGMVQYRAGGGSIFQPRGTDTVPAMLTPGEFVIRKSAVDKVGVGALQAINNGNSSVGLARGGVVYRQQGGPIGAGINAQNLQFDDAVSIMSGDQFQSIVRESVKRLPKNEVLKILSSVNGGENVAKDVRLLLNRGTFPANRLNIGSGTARLLDNLVANKSIFSSASAAGATLRTPTPPALLKDGATSEDLNIFKEYWQNYKSGLLSAVGGDFEISRNRELAANELVKKTTGMDVLKISLQVRQALLDRATKVGEFLQSINEAKTQDESINIARGGFALGTDISTEQQKAQAEKLRRAGFAGLDRVSQGAIDRLQKSGILFSSGGKVPYFATGGSVGGDSVPAMLTPGEFVMSAGAVKKHGVGFMNTLNRGQVQGFNKGGPVQYRQQGGSINSQSGGNIPVDTTKIEGVFGGFVDNLSAVFDNIVSPLSSVVQALNQMSQSFGNFTMQHTVTVDGLISLGGLNVESIKNELSRSIGEMVGDEVKRALDDKNKTFKSN